MTSGSPIRVLRFALRSAKFEWLSARSFLHVEHQPDHVRPGAVGHPAKQKTDFIAHAAKIGHDDRVLRNMPAQRGRCECGAALPASMEHRSTGASTLGDALQREPRIAPLNQFRPGRVQDRVLQPGAPSSFDFISLHHVFRLRCILHPIELRPPTN